MASAGSFLKWPVITLTVTFNTSNSQSSSDWFDNPLDDSPYMWKVFFQSVSGNKTVVQDRLLFVMCRPKPSFGIVLRPYACGYRFSLPTPDHLVFRSEEVNWNCVSEVPFEKPVRISKKLGIIKESELVSSVTISFSLSVVTDLDVLRILHAPPPIAQNKLSGKRLPEPDNGSEMNRRLFESKPLADVIIEVEGGKEIAAHKCILAANSSVFQAMFMNDHLEKHSERVVLAHLSEKVVEEMLKFCYLGSLNTADGDVLCSLLEVADCYDVLKLREICESALISKLSLNHQLAMRTLPIAAKLDLVDLKLQSEVALLKYSTNTKSAVTLLHLALACSSDLLVSFFTGILMMNRSYPITQQTGWRDFARAYNALSKIIETEFSEPRNRVSGRFVSKP